MKKLRYFHWISDKNKNKNKKKKKKKKKKTKKKKTKQKKKKNTEMAIICCLPIQTALRIFL